MDGHWADSAAQILQMASSGQVKVQLGGPLGKLVQYISVNNRIKSNRFTSWFMTSATAGLQSDELRIAEYITGWQTVMNDGPEYLSNQAVNWIRDTEEVDLEIIDTALSESLK
ncbi:hypothetical protein K440DRAFT_645680 [Wilcoxina mikolae CBS 423.85]|nr:hypothetical protein K440DRAFT_645680 [Wilcoxina mikolae CBS 423.85]